MTQETDQLGQKIEALQKQKNRIEELKNPQNGMQIVINLLTNLLGCVLIGSSIGYFCQKAFNTPVTLTVGLTILGGFAGLYSVVKYLIELEKRS